MNETVQFTMVPEGNPETVVLKGEWNNWEEAALKRKKDGSWYIRKKVPHGSWQFGFLCDGVWAVDSAYPTVLSPFGSVNNCIDVGGEQ